MNLTMQSVARFLLPILAVSTLCDQCVFGQPLTRFDSATDWDQMPKLFKAKVKAGRSVTIQPEGILYEFSPVTTSNVSGLTGEMTLRGNFEISVCYELIDWPTYAQGTGMTLGITVESSTKLGRAAMKRGLYEGRRDQHRLTRAVRQNDKWVYGIAGVPTNSNNGRIVMRRIGSEVIGLSSDTPDGELIEITRYPFTDQPIYSVKLDADVGGSGLGFTARLYDLQIRTGDDVSTQPTAVVVDARIVKPLPENLPPSVGPVSKIDSETEGDEDVAAQTKVRGYWWLLAIPMIGVFAIGMYLGRKRKQRLIAPRRP